MYRYAVMKIWKVMCKLWMISNWWVIQELRSFSLSYISFIYGLLVDPWIQSPSFWVSVNLGFRPFETRNEDQSGVCKHLTYVFSGTPSYELKLCSPLFDGFKIWPPNPLIKSSTLHPPMPLFRVAFTPSIQSCFYWPFAVYRYLLWLSHSSFFG